MKESFSGPRYVIAAAKAAAEFSHERTFSTWLEAAVRAKLNAERPGLIDSVREHLELAAGEGIFDGTVQESGATADPVVTRALTLAFAPTVGDQLADAAANDLQRSRMKELGAEQKRRDGERKGTPPPPKPKQSEAKKGDA